MGKDSISIVATKMENEEEHIENEKKCSKQKDISSETASESTKEEKEEKIKELTDVKGDEPKSAIEHSSLDEDSQEVEKHQSSQEDNKSNSETVTIKEENKNNLEASQTKSEIVAVKHKEETPSISDSKPKDEEGKGGSNLVEEI